MCAIFEGGFIAHEPGLVEVRATVSGRDSQKINGTKTSDASVTCECAGEACL